MKISTLDNLRSGTDKIFYDDIYSPIPPDKPIPKVPPTKKKIPRDSTTRKSLEISRIWLPKWRDCLFPTHKDGDQFVYGCSTMCPLQRQQPLTYDQQSFFSP